jgi:hypothetical protein
MHPLRDFLDDLECTINSDLLAEDVEPLLPIRRERQLMADFASRTTSARCLSGTLGGEDAVGSPVESDILTIAAAEKDDESNSVAWGSGRDPFQRYRGVRSRNLPNVKKDLY